MVCRTHTPGPPLSDFVELFWSCEGDPSPHPLERVIPTGTVQLIVNLSDDELRVYDRQDHDRFRSFGRSMISGAHSRFVVIDRASQVSTVGVHFKPGGARPFLGVPMDALRDEDAPLAALWGAGASDLRARLLGARTPGARFDVLERSLLARASPLPSRHPAVAFALHEFRRGAGRTSVKEVGDQVGLSQRRFIQIFREEVGLTPKVFWRIRRFQLAIGLASNGRRVEWADIALRCGYFDQAHFIHDFRAFSGITPMTYLAQRSAFPNHVGLERETRRAGQFLPRDSSR